MNETRSSTGGILTVASALLATVLLAGLISAGRDLTPVADPATDMRSEHAAMIEQMRVEVTPQMVERMNEPYWRNMRAPGHLAEMEAHQRQVDRMLARSPSPRGQAERTVSPR